MHKGLFFFGKRLEIKEKKKTFSLWKNSLTSHNPSEWEHCLKTMATGGIQRQDCFSENVIMPSITEIQENPSPFVLNSYLCISQERWGLILNW